VDKVWTKGNLPLYREGYPESDFFRKQRVNGGEKLKQSSSETESSEN
jgi:hypothetical protein